MAAKRMPPAGRPHRTPGAVQPPRTKGALPGGLTKQQAAQAVYPSKPQPDGSAPTPQGGSGS